jgi:hypothetical protein
MNMDAFDIEFAYFCGAWDSWGACRRWGLCVVVGFRIWRWPALRACLCPSLLLGVFFLFFVFIAVTVAIIFSSICQ